MCFTKQQYTDAVSNQTTIKLPRQDIENEPLQWKELIPPSQVLSKEVSIFIIGNFWQLLTSLLLANFLLPANQIPGWHVQMQGRVDGQPIKSLSTSVVTLYIF